MRAIELSNQFENQRVSPSADAIHHWSDTQPPRFFK
jgi:hypothetical protein